MSLKPKFRIIIIDDNTKIHADFTKILQTNTESAFDKISKKMFSKKNTALELPCLNITTATQGEEATKYIEEAKQENNPYALAFLDIRMPPGWDGIETAKRIWQIDPDIQIVFCTAYSDYSIEEILNELNSVENFLILKKPFDTIEVRQMVYALTQKWQLTKQVNSQIDSLHILTAELDASLSLTRATLESTQEGILVISKNDEVVDYNKLLLNLWDISAKDLLGKSNVIFQKLAEQTNEQDLFLSVMNDLCKEKNNSTIKEWATKEGKVLELYAQPQYLQEKIIGTVFSFRDISERKFLEKKLLHHATHDTLTNLPNRILLNEHVNQAIVTATEQGLHIGVFLLDLDNFKQINDTLGHDIGDLFLKEVSNRLKKSISEIDIVARLGGDEFIIVYTALSKAEEIQAKAKELLELFSYPFLAENNSINITTSIGGCVYPEDGADFTTLIKNADIALYYSKENGKNSSQFYYPHFSESLIKRGELIKELKNALANNEFVLHYQPLINLTTGKIDGIEALIRWEHPKLGLILPQIFIPLSEEIGLINEIGEWVLRTACRQGKIWQTSITSDLCMAVNISVHQFRQKNFVTLIQTILTETFLDPHFLELEITESIILDDLADVAAKMQQLKNLGVQLSIDDFGTGYSNISYLRYLPFDKVKIDKSFIAGINMNTADNNIIAGIINMTKSMGLKVLAEGVENQDQVDYLKLLSSNQLQGYYFSPALDRYKCEKFLKKQQQFFMQNSAASVKE